jgi:hypothetical protein
MIFGVEYDLSHNAREVAGDNWTVNEKENIYSEVVRMDSVRIGIFRRTIFFRNDLFIGEFGYS